MKNLIYIFCCSFVLVFSACKKEPDPVTNDTTDTTSPVITLTTPIDGQVYHNGDTVFMAGSVTDNSLHEGTITMIDDTTSASYYSYNPYVHGLTTAAINFNYIVTGITQNSAVTLSVSYVDHAPNSSNVTRHLIFMP